jgi:hypothetical protein
MATQFNPSGYRSGHLRALAAMWLLGACAGVHLLFAILHGFMAGGVLGGPNAVAAGEETQQVVIILNAGLLLLNFFAYVGTVVAFLMWLHRAYSNLRPLGAKWLQYTPGWAVGYFFIPFLNLVRPYQAVREVWRWSQSGTIEELSFTSDTGAPLVGWWWGFWIAANVASNIYSRTADAKEAIDAAPWLGLADDLLTIVAAAFAIIMIRSIDQMQTERSKRVELSGASFDQPPPPPTFGVQSLNLG